jgi:trigger factor
VAELADALDLGSSPARGGGSTPPFRTIDRESTATPDCEIRTDQQIRIRNLNSKYKVGTKLTAEIIEVNSCRRNLLGEIPAQEVEQEINQIAREYSRTIKVPGFRPGKVPMTVIRQRFGNDLVQEATHKIIERCWKDAISQHDLHPLTQPEIKDVDNKPGNPLKFTLSFEILPPLEVKDYQGVAVTMDSAEITDDAVNKTIDNVREQNAQFVPVDGGEAKDGHYLTATVDGQFEDGRKPSHEEDVTLVIGNPQTNADFSENLRGTKAGDTRSFDVSYPEDFHRKEFAGNKVHYTVLVKEIKEKQLAELNDDFAKDMGFDSFEAFKTKVHDDLVTQAKQTAEKKAREALLDSIIERQPIEVPDCMVEEELTARTRQLASSLMYQGIDLNQIGLDWKKIFEEERPRAAQAVRRSIFLDAIARQENVLVTEEEIDAELQKMAEGTNKSAATWRSQLEKEDRMHGFEQHLRQNKALDFIYRNANINVG